MAGKHLHELLREDQEAFHLNSFIADRRFPLKRSSQRTTIQVKKRRPIVESSTSKLSLCKHACFFSLLDSPDVRKSPLPAFLTPERSPCNNKPPNVVRLHVPARTAALLLESAIRIQKQSSSKSKTQNKNVGFRLFGSILKRLKDRNRTKRPEIGDVLNETCVAGGRFSKKSQKTTENVVEERAFAGVSCSCNQSSLSSAGWSEANEEKSLDLESSSSCRSEEIEFPSSPFRFSLRRSPPRQTPDLLSPATSPTRHRKEEEEKYEENKLQKFQLKKEEEDEKEQSSPVSILETDQFEEEEGDDDDDNCNENWDDEEDEYDIECSYEIVQRAKLQLLKKLRRFEKLAELDPIELEKRMLEEQEEEEAEYDDRDSKSPDRHDNVNECLRHVFSRSDLEQSVSSDTKRLILDLIEEEKRELNGHDSPDRELTKRVCKRLDVWTKVESNTINMMVELDFRCEIDGWRKYQEQMGEMAMEIEGSILGLLVEEVFEE